MLELIPEVTSFSMGTDDESTQEEHVPKKKNNDKVFKNTERAHRVTGKGKYVCHAE